MAAPTQDQSGHVIEFLVLSGTSSPLDVGVCVLGDEDGSRAWRVLNKLREAGYVDRVSHGRYEGRRGVAVAQRVMF